MPATSNEPQLSFALQGSNAAPGETHPLLHTFSKDSNCAGRSLFTNDDSLRRIPQTVMVVTLSGFKA